MKAVGFHTIGSGDARILREKIKTGPIKFFICLQIIINLIFAEGMATFYCWRTPDGGLGI